MFSKLARSAGQVAPLVRNGFQVRYLAVTGVRPRSAQPPAPAVQSLMQKHLTQLEGLNVSDQSLVDDVVGRQASELQAMSVQDQEQYCSAIAAKYGQIPKHLAELLHVSTTTARRVKCGQEPAASVGSLVQKHAQQLQSFNFKQKTIEEAVWLVALQAAELQALSPRQQEDYYSDLTEKFPQLADCVAQVQDIFETRADLLAEVEKLAERVLPPAQKILDIKDELMDERDFRIDVQRGKETKPEYPLTTLLRQLQEDPGSESVKQKIDAFIKESQNGQQVQLKKARVERWNAVSNRFFGEEWDKQKYPLEARTWTNRKPMRYKVLPSTPFDAMYDKTGVSGPHFMLYATLIFLVSKQHFNIYWDGVYLMAGTFAMLVILTQYTGVHKVYKQLRLRRSTDKYDYVFKRAKENDIALCKAQIEECERLLAGMGSKEDIYMAMRENVDLQLEAEYRQRQEKVYEAVKKRLDYQVALVGARQQYEMKHMTNWIIDSVEKSITPQLEKEILAKCFIDLKALSQKYASSA